MPVAADDRLRQLQARVQELEDAESEKNGVISHLRGRLADLEFERHMQPVEQMLSQTPYSRKNLNPSQESAGAMAPPPPPQDAMSDDAVMEHGDDVFMSQQICEPALQVPTASEAVADVPASRGVDGNATGELSELNSMQSLIAELQRRVNKQVSVCRAGMSVGGSSWGVSSNGHTSVATHDADAKLRALEDEVERTNARAAQLEEANASLQTKLQTVLRQWNSSAAGFPTAQTSQPAAVQQMGTPENNALAPPPPSSATSVATPQGDADMQDGLPTLEAGLQNLKDFTLLLREFEEARAAVTAQRKRLDGIAATPPRSAAPQDAPPPAATPSATEDSARELVAARVTIDSLKLLCASDGAAGAGDAVPSAPQLGGLENASARGLRALKEFALVLEGHEKLRRANSALRARVATAEDAVRTKEATQEEGAAALDTLRADVDHLRGKLEDSTAAQAQLCEELEAAQRKHADAAREVDAMQAQLSAERQAAADELAAVRAEAERLAGAEAHLRAEVEAAHARAAEADVAVNELRAQVREEDAIRTIASLKDDDRAAPSQEVAALNKQLEQQRAAAETAERELHQRLANSEAQAHTAQQALQSAADQQAAVQQQLAGVQAALQTAEARAGELEQKCLEAEAACTTLRSEGEAKDKQVAWFSDKLERAGEEMGQLRDEAAKAQEEVAAERAVLQEEMERVQSNAAKARADGEKQLAQLRSELSTTHTHYQEQHRSLNERVAAAEAAVTTVQEDLVKAQRGRDDVQSTLTCTQAEVEVLNNTLAAKEQELVAARALQREVDEARHELEMNRGLLRELEQRAASLIEERNKEVNARKGLEADMEKLASEHAQLAEKETAHTEAIIALNQKVTDSDKRAAAYATELDEHCDKIQRMKQELEEMTASERMVRELRDEVASASANVASLEADAKAWQMVKVELEERVRVAESENASLRLQVLEVATPTKVASPKKRKAEDQDAPTAAPRQGPPQNYHSPTESKRRKLGVGESNTPTAAVPPRIILSGFKSTDDRREVADAVKHLSGRIVKTGVDMFDPTCSHIIIPNNEARTIKTVAAVLCGKWVMTRHWIHASKDAGRWLDEAPYGYQLPHEGLQKRTVFLSEGFRKNGGADRVRQAQALIGYGGGREVETAAEADVVLCFNNERNSLPGGQHFNNVWEAFIEWIFPTDWRPPCTL